jgi:7-carboxy-7-deazaguanine synthase
MAASETMLDICEIFYSIQGEGGYAGLPCIFIRLAGCNLECRWCDTTYARANGDKKNIDTVLAEIISFPTDLVMITGGEPLHQEGTTELITRLVSLKYRVLLNTNGSYPLSGLPKEITRVVDVKCPGSGEAASFLQSNISCIRRQDEINFVIADMADFSWAISFINDKLDDIETNIYFTPAYGLLDSKELADWILNAKNGKIRLGIQLHKIIWGVKRGV